MRIFKIFSALLLATVLNFANASTPRILSHNSRTDFERGTFKNISILHGGKITLAPQKSRLIDTGDPFVWAVVQDNKGNVYLGTGNDGRIYKISADGDSSLFFDAKELEVYALAIDRHNRLFAATSPDGKIYKINAKGQSSVFFDPDEKYIWSLVFDGKGNLYAATGEKARVYKITPQGKSSVLLESDETHIRSLAVDSNGLLYAGSSGHGYVYKIAANAKPYVLFDTQMKEVHSLAVAPDGEIFAAAFGEAGVKFPQAGATSAQQVGQQASTQGKKTGGTASEVALAPQSIIPESMLRATKAQTSLFRIDKNGYAKNIWLDNDAQILTLASNNKGEIIVGTGNKGKLYQVNRNGEISMLLSTEESQITSLGFAAKGSLLLGTANMGRCYRIGVKSAAKASFESETIDTGALSSWGILSWEGSGEASFFTRSGNTEHPQKTWSEWKACAAKGENLRITSPVARFLQWKCELQKTKASSPVIDKVTISYIQNNLPPEITAVVIHRPGDYYGEPQSHKSATPGSKKSGLVYPTPLSKSEYKKGFRSVDWLFEDPNFDGLKFNVYYRRLGDRFWKALAKDLEQSVYSWDSSNMADGKYEIKVTASDAPGNPARYAMTSEKRSDPFIVDNSGPETQNFQTPKPGILRFSVTDTWSSIKSTYYSIDAGEWLLVYPTDGISDSKSEDFEITIPKKIKGDVSIAIKAQDSVGNIKVAHTVIKRSK